MVLVAIAVAAGVYAFVCGVRGDRRALELRRWVSEHRRDSWQTLPWIHRQVFTAGIAARVLKRTALGADREFAARYARVIRLQRSQLVAIAVAMACIALALIGTRVWGWTW